LSDGLSNTQQSGRGLAQYQLAFGFAHGSAEPLDGLHGVFEPHIEAVVAAQQHAVGAHAPDQVEIDLVREYTETVKSEYVKAGDKWGRVLKVNGAVVQQPAWMAIIYLGSTICKAEYSLPSVPAPLPSPKVKIVSLTVIANYEDGTTTTEVFDPVQ